MSKTLSTFNEGSPCHKIDSEKSANWMDEITDSESEDVINSSGKLEKSHNEEDLYLEIIKNDLSRDANQEHPSVAPALTYQPPGEVITVVDKDSSEDEKVNQYLDDIERKLEENIKKRSHHKDEDNWQVVNYFSDIICVKEINNVSKANKTLKSGDKRNVYEKRKKAHVSPSRNESYKRRRKDRANLSLSDGEIISDEDLILSDVSLTPEQSSNSAGHRKGRSAEFRKREADYSRTSSRAKHSSSVHSRNYSRKSRCERYRRKLNGDRGYESSVGSPDHSPSLHDVRERRRIVRVEPDSISSRYADRHRQSHRSKSQEQSEHRRHSPEQDVSRKRCTEKHKSKKHCKCETKREAKSKSSSDYFDEDRYHGSDKSRIRTLKKKYNEYLRYAKKFKNEEQDIKHIEKFAEMRSRLKEDSGSKEAEIAEASIDYKKEEEKFLRSLETYLEIKKKQEKSMSGAALPIPTTTESKEYDPENITSEEEYIPEKFTPEDISSGNVEEYDPCDVSKTSEASFTYQPTKIDEYEPVLLQMDEEYCPTPVENSFPLTYNPTKKDGNNTGVPRQHLPSWMKLPVQYPTIPYPPIHNANTVRARETIPQKVISKNTVFIGNIVNPFALKDNCSVGPGKPTVAPVTASAIDKTKLMSKLLNEKLLEIEKKKLQLLEEINRKKLLKIKEQCDEVALKNLEKRKSDLMQEIYKKTNSELPLHLQETEKEIQVKNVSTKVLAQDGNIKKYKLGKSNNIEIKQEELDTIAPANEINEKLSALQKKKADLMLQINRKLTINTEKINKEKAEVTSKLEALEKSKSELLAQVNRKEAEQKTKTPVFIKKEKDDPSELKTSISANVTSVNTTVNGVKIKQELETPLEKQPMRRTGENRGGSDKETPPLINKKLNLLELEKEKLLAQIAAKSSKTSVVAVQNEKPKLTIISPETLNEKLGNLAKKKDELLLAIEKKNKTGTPLSSIDVGNISHIPAGIPAVNIKKEKDDNASNVSIKQEKSDSDAHSNQTLNSEIKREKIEHENPQLLAAKINELAKQKAQLLQNLAKKLPRDKKTMASNVGPKAQKCSVSFNKFIAKTSVNNLKIEKTPVAIVKLAGQVKLKVNQQLTEITKKKTELMRQIQSKSFTSPSVVENTNSSTANAISIVTSSAKEKLLELERNKLKLLMEIEKKANEKTCDKENVVETSQGAETDGILKTNPSDDLRMYVVESEESPSCPDDEIFKIPQTPRFKCVTRNPSKLKCSNKIMKSKTRSLKSRRAGMALLSKKKAAMIEKYRKLKALEALWTKSDETNLQSDGDDQNEPFSEGDTCNPTDVSFSSCELHLSTGSAAEQSLNVNEEVREPGDEFNVDHDDVEILGTPTPVPKQIDLITIEDEHSRSREIKPKRDIGNRLVECDEEITNSNEDDIVANSDGFITLKFIKVEKLSALDDDRGRDDGNDNAGGKNKEENESKTEDEEKDKSFNREFRNEDGVWKSEGHNEDMRETDASTSQKCEIVETTASEEDDIIFLKENSNDLEVLSSSHKGIGCPTRLYCKNATVGLKIAPRATNSPVVSKLILNNRRKLISGLLGNEKNYSLLKLAQNNAKSLKFKFARSNYSRPEQSSTQKSTNKCGKVFEKNLELQPRNFAYVNSNRPKKRKIEPRENHTNEGHAKNTKVERKSHRFKFDKRKAKARHKSVSHEMIIGTENHLKGSNTSKYKLSNTTHSMSDTLPVISKFKLVHVKPNTKITNYKTLPLSIRRQVANRFKLSNTSPRTPNRTDGCTSSSRRKSVKRHSMSKYKTSNSCKRADPSSSLNVSTPRKSTKSRYKLCRVFLRTSSTTSDQADKLRSGNRTLKRSSTPRKNDASYKAVRQNHLVSKYKMVRISNQRERNKLNLSHRVQESCYPNRSMRVVNLDGATYRVSSRSLKRKLSSCSDRLSSSTPLRRSLQPSTPLRRSLQSSTPLRRSLQAFPSGNIFSNRQIIGRHYLTSSRLRSLAVLTSRLRKNNVLPATPKLGPVYSQNRGFLKGPGRVSYQAGEQGMGSVSRSSSRCYNQSKQTSCNLCFTSRAEELKCRRTSGHRQKRRRCSRRKYLPPPSVPSSPLLPTSTDSSAPEPLRYFDSDDPRSNLGPEAEECVETVIPRRARRVGDLPGYIPL